MNKISLFTILVLLSVCVSISYGNESTPSKLTFVYTRPLDHPVTQWLALIYTEALNRMDIKIEILEVSPKRGSVYSDDGDVDGELGRIYSYSDTHPNLVRVNEHHAVIAFSAYMLDPATNLKGWNSLKGKNYFVEYRRGIAKCEVQLPRVVPSERLSVIRTVDLGIQRLLQERIQVYVDVQDFVLAYLDSNKFKRINEGKTVYKAGVMEQTTGHAFLHKKHQKLVPKLSAILKKMKAEGLFDSYRKKTGIYLTW